MSRDYMHKIYRHAFPHWAKNALSRSIVDLERFHPPEVVDLPPGNSVIVLAPHPDDESIGCGGTICKYIESGASVRVVIMTDGCQGDRELRKIKVGSKQRVQLESDLAEVRKQESRSALDVLGVSDIHYLDAPDGKLLGNTNETATTLAKLLEEQRPDAVLLPFLTDRHLDHFATNSCLVKACEKLDAGWTRNLQCIGYEIWSPIYANTIVDISDLMPRKHAAIECYKSQLKDNDYIAGVSGLNKFRAISGLTGGHYAEAFFSAPFQTYRRLYESLLIS